MLTAEQKQQYLKGGGVRCPYCGTKLVSAVVQGNDRIAREWRAHLESIIIGPDGENMTEEDKPETPESTTQSQPEKWLVVVWGDCEPALYGPFASDEERDKEARKIRYDHGDGHGIYPLEFGGGQLPMIEAYNGDFFEDNGANEEPEGKPRFLNHYRCTECGEEWEDEWSCTCNDKCPKCGTEIEPYQSDEIAHTPVVSAATHADNTTAGGIDL